MYTDSKMNNYFSGMRKPQINLSNITSTNALVQNKLQANGDVAFKSSLTVNDNIETLAGNITSAGYIHSENYIASGVVTVPLYNTGGGATEYNTLNSSADIFIDSTKGNIFSITAPSGSSLANLYIYFNTSPLIPGTIPAVNGTVMTILFHNLTNRIVTVNISGSVVKRTSNTITIPSLNRSNIVFVGHSNIISEISRSGSMAS